MENNLENLSAVVSEHRQGKKRGQYPSLIWASITELRKQHTVEEISKATGINAIHIYRKTSRRRRVQFREVKLVPPPSTQPVSRPVVIELRREDGAELRLRTEVRRDELSTIFAEFLR